MSAPQDLSAEWLDREFWERLERLEGRHQQIQSDHESARRGLERLTAHEADELRRAWHRYCEVIAELEKTTVEFEALRR